MGYKKPENDGNSFATLGTFQRSPYEQNYKGKVGTVTRMRIMSLHGSQIQRIACIKVPVQKWNDPNEETTIVVHDPGPEAAATIKNYKGVPLSAMERTSVVRIPVFVFWRHDSEKNERQEINKLKYIEFTSQVRDGINDLPNSLKGMDLAFNPDTGRPDYEIDIEVVSGTGKWPNYEVNAVVFSNGEKVKSFGVETDIVLKKFMPQIDQDWDAVQEDIHKVDSAEDTARRVAPRALASETGEADVSTKPELKAVAEEPAAVEVKPAARGRKAAATVEEAVQEEVTDTADEEETYSF